MESSSSQAERISAEDLSTEDEAEDRVSAPVEWGFTQPVPSPAVLEGVSATVEKRTQGCITPEGREEEARGFAGARLKSTEAGIEGAETGGAEGIKIEEAEVAGGPAGS